MVGGYGIVFLGSCSPIHCRSTVAITGLVCVGFCYTTGYAISFWLGGKVAGVHSLMAFLLIGIGVDDMFVVCNALD